MWADESTGIARHIMLGKSLEIRLERHDAFRHDAFRHNAFRHDTFRVGK